MTVMAVYNIGLNAARTIAYVTIDPEPLPVEATIVLTDIEHDDADDAVHAFAANHVLAHHVRDLLYKRKASDGSSGATYPNGMYDLSKVSIVKSGDLWAAEDIRITAVADLDLSDLDTATLEIKYFPSMEVADNDHFTYVSSDPSKATVSAAGLVTAVGVGTTTITVSQAATGFEATVVITVVA
jgi:hypothetical protein